MSVSYKYHRFSIKVIRHFVWLYYTFSLSFRGIEKMMPYRGIEVTYEAIHKWCRNLLKPRPIRFIAVIPSLPISGILMRL
ncbi:MAG: hypothetical protein AAF892_00665 [Cyanobacteria bacterium P01_D01_bin.71]